MNHIWVWALYESCISKYTDRIMPRTGLRMLEHHDKATGNAFSMMTSHLSATCFLSCQPLPPKAWPQAGGIAHCLHLQPGKASPLAAQGVAFSAGCSPTPSGLLLWPLVCGATSKPMCRTSLPHQGRPHLPETTLVLYVLPPKKGLYRVVNTDRLPFTF